MSNGMRSCAQCVRGVASTELPATLNLFRILSLAIIALLLGASVVQADELNDLATQAMELSGTREILEGLGKSLDREVTSDPRLEKLSKGQRAELMDVLKSALDGRRIEQELTSALVASGDRERLAEAVAAMHDPIYLKVTHRVVVESLNTTPQALAAYAKGFQKHPPDPERVQLIQRLDTATGGSRILADTRYEMVSKTLGGMLTEADRDARLAKLREQIDVSAPNEYLLLTLYACRKIESKDLQGYVHAHENEPMGWLSRQLGYAIQRSMVNAMTRMAEKLVDLTAKGP
ncbi:MAG: hypothetical protein J0I76_07170 [Thiobacillus sp.]|nr:hypothetical protein [Thiobacillus sp.]